MIFCNFRTFRNVTTVVDLLGFGKFMGFIYICLEILEMLEIVYKVVHYVCM